MERDKQGRFIKGHKGSGGGHQKGTPAWNKGFKHSEEHKDNLKKAWIKRRKKGLVSPPNKGNGKGWITSLGYKCRMHNGKVTRENRYVWEKHNGPIPKGGHIHHINEDKLDNRIENLQLFKSNSEHLKYHTGKK